MIGQSSLYSESESRSFLVPERWAAEQNDLGVDCFEKTQGNRAENIEQAIDAFQKALQVYTRDAFPEKWAMTQNNLGTAYGDRIRGERAENIEQAIDAFQRALQVRTRNAFPEKWAMTQNNLGNAYRFSIRGERSDNIEQAISAYQKALQIYTRGAFPEDWAITQNNLGSAYSVRIRGERADNIEQAISAYQKALQVLTRHAFPEDWAMTQGNLAIVLSQRASLPQNSEDLEQSIALLQLALEVATLGSPYFINHQYVLGNVLSRRYEYSQNPSDLRQALHAYKVALNAISPEHFDRGQIWQAIPETQSILGQRLVHDGQWQQGLQLLLNSINQLRTSDNRLAHANALYQVGYAHETLSDWHSARLYYRDALRLYQDLDDPYGIAKSRVGLGSVLASQGHLEKGMAELLAAHNSYEALGQPDKAATVDQIYQAAKLAKEQQGVYA
ncbi:MAG: tetratricopeptide repeat protein [Thermosynechococcaceae cyanobacterium]